MAELDAVFEFLPQEEISADFEIGNQQQINADFEINVQVSQHNQLQGRDAEDCHPISSITGLSDSLNTLGERIDTEKEEREGADSDLQTQINNISILAHGYVHEQGVSSAVWTVQHNLNKYPSVTVVDSSENEIIAEIEYIDKNTVQITMTGASKGRAYLN